MADRGRGYSDIIQDHFQHPRNVGVIEAADSDVSVSNPACGDIMQLSLRIADERIGGPGTHGRPDQGGRPCHDRAAEGRPVGPAVTALGIIRRQSAGSIRKGREDD